MTLGIRHSTYDIYIGHLTFNNDTQHKMYDIGHFVSFLLEIKRNKYAQNKFWCKNEVFFFLYGSLFDYARADEFPAAGYNMKLTDHFFSRILLAFQFSSKLYLM